MGALASFGSFAQLASGLLWQVDNVFIADGILIVVLAWSGLAKVLQPTSAAMALVTFGLTRRLRRELGFASGVVELSTAVLIAARPTRIVGGATAAILLLGFLVLLVRQFVRGDRSPCRCFGASEEPLGLHDLFRTGLLAVLALIIVAAPAPAITFGGWVIAISAGAGLVGVVVLSFELAHLLTLARHRHLIERLR